MRAFVLALVAILLLWALSEPREFGSWIGEIKRGVDTGLGSGK